MSGKITPYGGHAFSDIPVRVQIEPGDLLARVWDSAAGATGGYGGTSWNPTRKDLSDEGAGRFDPLPPEVMGSGFLYGSMSNDTEKVVILETFRSLMARDPAHGGRNTLARAERDRRSIVHFRVHEPIELINLNSQRGRECFRMDEEVLYVHSRAETRGWAHAIKDAVDGVQGLSYNSTRDSLDQHRASFIMWEERMPVATFNVVENIPLSSTQGRSLVDTALADYDVFWN
jgi:hypothetical protein